MLVQPLGKGSVLCRTQWPAASWGQPAQRLRWRGAGVRTTAGLCFLRPSERPSKQSINQSSSEAALVYTAGQTGLWIAPESGAHPGG